MSSIHPLHSEIGLCTSVDLKSTLYDKPESRANRSVAIVGIGCRYPGQVYSVDSFWKLLLNAVDATGPVPLDRWNNNRLSSPNPVGEPGSIRAERAGFFHDIAEFDAGFFGISPREAAVMDPQQRIVLEAAYDALEDGGQTLDEWSGQQVGVFIGAASTDYSHIQFSSPNSISGHTISGTTLSIIANRISYQFDFKGPSLVVDTACSSSLTALDLACRSVISGDCRLALVGGVNALLTPITTMGFSSATMLAPDGRCKAFDANANGYARGEGAGVVVLKPLAAAMQDQDRIYAIIKGTVTNQDGHTSSMTVPNGDAHQKMLRRAYEIAGISPSEMRYIEAHGTGTPVGDPVEVNALGAVLAGNGGDLVPCYLGSVKTNIGHLEAGAGIAGLIKASLAVHHGVIPASLNFDSENPDLHLAKYDFRVPTQSLPWPDDGRPRRAGVNSFGFGGANAHVVIEQTPSAEADIENEVDQKNASPNAVGRAHHLLTISARSETALKVLAHEHEQALRNGYQTIEAYCRAAARRRTHHEHRLAVIAEKRDDLTAKLAHFRDGHTPQGVMQSGDARDYGGDNGPVFVFSGMGPQWWGMGRQLYHEEPVFRQWIERCDAALSHHTNWSLIEEMMRCDEAASRMSETQISQPANFALQVALARLWQSWGVKPAAIVGHSAGEVAAAYLSNMLSLDDAVLVIFHRSRLQHRTSGQGSMMAVGLSFDDAQVMIEGMESKVSIAAINGPRSITLSGDCNVISDLAERLESDGVFHRMLRVDVPFHSHYMDSLKDDLHSSLDCLTSHKPSVPLYSTVTGERVDGLGYDAAYWWRNVREPVLFASAVDALVHSEHRNFLEISPHPVLSSLVSEGLGRFKASGMPLASLRRGGDEFEDLLTSLAQLYVNGQDVDWEAFYPGNNTYVALPRYPWQRKRYWHEDEEATNNRLLPSDHPLLGTRLLQPEPCWLNDISLHRHAYLADHQVQGSAIFPAAGYIELALAAGRELFDTIHLQLEDMVFERALVLSKDHPRVAQVHVSRHHDSVSMHSRPLGQETTWADHMHGRIRQRAFDSRRRFSLDELKERCSDDVTDRCYATFALSGLEYGPCFRGITRLYRGRKEALATLRPLDPSTLKTDTQGLDRYILHPSLLDACLQALLGTLLDGDANALTYLPVGLGQLRLYDVPKSAEQYFVHARLSLHNDDKLEGNIYLFDADGRMIVEIRDLSCKAQRAKVEKIDWLYADSWEQHDIHQGIDGTWADSVTPRAIEAAIRPSVLDLVDDHAQGSDDSGLVARLETLAIASIVETFETLGADWQVGDSFTVDTLRSSLSIEQRYQGLIRRFLQALTSVSLLDQVDDRTWLVRSCYAGPFAAVISREIKDQFEPDLPELVLIDHCRPYLAEVLKGEVDPFHAIFPPESPSPTEAIFTDTFGIYNAFIDRAVDAIIRQLPKDRQLRILEIGNGSIALASRLRRHLLSDRIHYTFTDASPAFLEKAKTMFADVSGIDFRVFDIETSPASQGFQAASFDIVLAGDVLCATRDLSAALDHAVELLVPRGLLLQIEMTAPPLWIDLTFGQLKERWAFQDTDVRLDHCCLGSDAWMELLQRCGQESIEVLSGGPLFDGQALHSVFLSARPQAPKTKASHADDATWLMVMDRAGIGDQIEAEFKRHDQKVIPLVFHDRGDTQDLPDEVACVVSGDHRALAACIGDIVDRHASLAGVIYLPALDAPSFDQADATHLDRFGKSVCLDLINLMKVLADLNIDPNPDVTLVTRDVQQVVEDDDVAGVLGAPIWGLGRVIANEYIDHKVILIDLPTNSTSQDIAGIHQELLQQGIVGEEVALRRGQRYVTRLKRTDWDQMERAQVRPSRSAEADDFCLDIIKSGSLDNFVLKQVPKRSLESHEVEIDVHHASINFRDLMKIMDIYPDENKDNFYFGDECSGTIRRVGSDVTSLVVGDRVAAMDLKRFGSVASTSAALAFRIPDHVSLQDAATLPIAFLTAWYALHELARVQPGERVLVHAAAGGVGLAAVQIAQQAGAEVFATASSEQKHAHLASMGVEHIMNSRTLDFHDEILAANNGEGIDIVLNSLAGEFIPASMKLLRTYGRFVEIGKADIYEENNLNLFPFRKNLAYFSVAMDIMFRERPLLVKKLIEDFLACFESKSLSPLPLTAFDINDAELAFRHMAQAKHIGKIVFDMRRNDKARIVRRAAKKKLFEKEASYLLTGGLGGFGLAVAEWMAAEGAGHIILGARRTGLDDRQQACIQTMEDAGCRVSVCKLDITDSKQTAQIIDDLCDSTSPLKGVMHMAMVLDDRYIRDQSERSFSKAFEPKAKGAWNLHQLTSQKDLDFFVMFSSFAATVGNPGQSNYVAANQFLEALASYRQAQGLPALALAWPPIADAGYVAEHEDIQRHFKRQGLTAMTTKEAVHVLEISLKKGLSNVAPFRIKWDDLLDYLPGFKTSKRLSYLTKRASLSDARMHDTGHILATLEETDPSQRQNALQVWLAHRLADLLAYDPDDFDVTKSLIDLGIDSLMAVQLATLIEQETEIVIPPMELSGSMSVSGLAAYLLEKISLEDEMSNQEVKIVPVVTAELNAQLIPT